MIHVLVVAGHVAGFIVDATMEGFRLMRALCRGATQEIGEVYFLVTRLAPWIEACVE